MFRQLNNLRLQRTPAQAMLFYLVYFFAALVLGALLGAFASVTSGSIGFSEGIADVLKTDPIFAVMLSGLLSLGILRAKEQVGDVRYLLVGVASVVGAVFGGLPLGLLFAAVLTTRPANPVIDAVARPVEAYSAQ